MYLLFLRECRICSSIVVNGSNFGPTDGTIADDDYSDMRVPMLCPLLPEEQSDKISATIFGRQLRYEN